MVKKIVNINAKVYNFKKVNLSKYDYTATLINQNFLCMQLEWDAEQELRREEGEHDGCEGRFEERYGQKSR